MKIKFIFEFNYIRYYPNIIKCMRLARFVHNPKTGVPFDIITNIKELYEEN